VADVYVTCTVSPCTVVHQIDLPPLQLDPADGALIAGAITAIWAIGWGFRALIRALHVDSVTREEGES
jgi:hypothetical protein